MFIKFKTSAIAAAVALIASGSAMATTLDTTSGDLFINIVDTTNNSSFLYDTGLTQAQFSLTGSYNYNFSTDANYLAFAAAAGATDQLDYSILSAVDNGSAGKSLLFSSNASPAKASGANITQATTFINGFFGQANLVTSTTSNSAYITAANGNFWGGSGYEVSSDSKLGIGGGLTPTSGAVAGSGDNAVLTDTLAFYAESTTAPTSAAKTATTLTAQAFTWSFNNGDVSYNTPVPLPTPVLLLLSGLGLMGAVARRSKAA